MKTYTMGFQSPAGNPINVNFLIISTRNSSGYSRCWQTASS